MTKHVNPGCDVTVDPRPPIDDSFRSKKMKKSNRELIELKCWSESFRALKDGIKRFEYRKDDRPYAVGVTLYQREWNPSYDEENDCFVSGGGYTGDVLYHDVTFIIRGGIFGIPEGYCIMSVTESRDSP